MAGEDQYINPIIQAMINSSQLQGQAAQRKQQADAEKVRQEQNQQQIDQATERLHNEHDYQQSLIKNATALLGAHLEQSRAEGLKTLGEMSASGMDVSKLAPGTPTNNLPQTGNPEIDNDPSLTQKTISLPGLGINNVPVNAFPTQEQAQQHATNFAKAQAFATTQGQAEAMAPYTAAGYEHTERLRKLENEGAYNRTLAAGANSERVARIREAGEAANTAAREAGANYRTQLTQGSGTDPDNAAIYDNAEDGIINGEEDLGKFPKPVQKHVLAIAAQKGDIIPTDTKSYKTALDNAMSAQQLLHQARDLANNYSSDSSGYTGFGSGLLNSAKTLNSGSDLKTAQDSLDAQINTVRTGLGVSRSSNPETERLLKGVYSPMRTKQQNLDNIEALAKQLNTSVQSVFPKNIPDSQKNRVLANRGITDFGGFGTKAPAPSGPITFGRDANGNIVRQGQ